MSLLGTAVVTAASLAYDYWQKDKAKKDKAKESERLAKQQADDLALNQGGDTPYRSPGDFSAGPRATGVDQSPVSGMLQMGTSDYRLPESTVSDDLMNVPLRPKSGDIGVSGDYIDTGISETGLSQLQKSDRTNKWMTGIGIGTNLLSLGIEATRKPSKPLQAPQKLETPRLKDRTAAYEQERRSDVDEAVRGATKSAVLRGESPSMMAVREEVARTTAGRGISTDVEKMRSEKERAEVGMGLQADQFNIRGQSGVDQANWLAGKQDALRSGETMSRSIGGLMNLSGQYAQQQSANAWNVENQIADYDRMMTEPGADIQSIKMAKKNFMRRNNIPGWENI